MATSGMAQKIVDQQKWLDSISDTIQPLVEKAFSETGEAGRIAKDFLSGVWLGHPLHPMITDVPIGAWTMSSIFDALSILSGDHEALDLAADISLVTGILGGIGAAISGISDWGDTYEETRRMGMAHALANTVGLGLNVLSLGARVAAGKRGSRVVARALSFGGYAVSAAAAYVAGELVFNLGQAINRNAWTEGPGKYTDVAPLEDLPDGKMKHFEVAGNDIIVISHEDGIHAVGGTCSHAGCPLWQGKLENHTLTCQCHGSQFDITDGSIIHGPATAPIPSYETRKYDGKLQIRERKE